MAKSQVTEKHPISRVGMHLINNITYDQQSNQRPPTMLLIDIRRRFDCALDSIINKDETIVPFHEDAIFNMMDDYLTKQVQSSKIYGYRVNTSSLGSTIDLTGKNSDYVVALNFDLHLSKDGKDKVSVSTAIFPRPLTV